jgi:hypothetical protein
VATGAFEPIGGGKASYSATDDRHIDFAPLDRLAARQALLGAAIPQPMADTIVRADDFARERRSVRQAPGDHRQRRGHAASA